MSSDERSRIGTKAGWFDDARHEAGVMFDATGRPLLICSTYASGQANPDDFGATHPAVAARAVVGREFLDAIEDLAAPVSLRPMPDRLHHGSNGG